MRSIKDLVNWYFSRRTFPYWCVLLLDSVILMFTSIFVYWCLYRGVALQQHFWPLIHLYLVAIAVHIVFFCIFHTYTGILRFSSFRDLHRLAYAMFCATIVMFAIHLFTNKADPSVFVHIQKRYIILTEALTTCFLCAYRVAVKMVYDVYFRSEGARNVLIYGVKDASIVLAKSINGEKPRRFVLKGFITQDPAHHSSFTVMMGVSVYTPDEVGEVVRKYNVKTLLVAPDAIESFRDEKALQDAVLGAGVKILTTSKYDGTGAPELKEVSVCDLLPRDEISVNLDEISAALKGRRVLITGSAGSIGSEIVRRVASFAPASMMLIDAAETPQHDIRLMMASDYPAVPFEAVVTSVTNPTRMERIFNTFRPEYVFHAAAYKHVPMMEDNPCESIQNNVLGTKILADMSVKYGVERFVMVSTDKAVNPTNVMGCSKRICEIYVQSLDSAERSGKVDGHTKFITTRFGNVLGSNGSVIPIFEKQIKAGGPVTVTDPEIVRFFMLIPEACELVLEAGVKGDGGEIFVFDMGKPVKIAELARKMIDLSGAKGVEVKYTGLRDGEKLYEEVLGDKEATLPSFNDKIRIASVREYEWPEVSTRIDDLIAISYNYDDMAIVAAMKSLVPEYISNHSKYSVLDHPQA